MNLAWLPPNDLPEKAFAFFCVLAVLGVVVLYLNWTNLFPPEE